MARGRHSSPNNNAGDVGEALKPTREDNSAIVIILYGMIRVESDREPKHRLGEVMSKTNLVSKPG